MTPKMEDTLRTLESWVFDELKLVSYKALSLKLDISADEAKRALALFVAKHPDRLQTTFFVSGYEPVERGGVHRVAVVSETKLEELRGKLERISGLHVYAVRTTKALEEAAEASAPKPDTSNLDLQSALWQSETRDILRSLYNLSLEDKAKSTDASGKSRDFLQRNLKAAIRNPNVVITEQTAPPPKEEGVVYSSPRSKSESDLTKKQKSRSSLSRSVSTSSRKKPEASTTGKKRKSLFPETSGATSSETSKSAGGKNAAKPKKQKKKALQSQISAMFAKQIAEAEAREANSVATFDDDDDDELGELDDPSFRDAMMMDTDVEEEDSDDDGRGKTTLDANALMQSLASTPRKTKKPTQSKVTPPAKKKQRRMMDSSSEDSVDSAVSDESDSSEEDTDRKTSTKRRKTSKKRRSQKRLKESKPPRGRVLGGSGSEEEESEDEEEVAGTQQPEEEITYSDLEDDLGYSDEEDEGDMDDEKSAMRRFMRNVITTGEAAITSKPKVKRRVERTRILDGYLVTEEVTESENESDAEDIPPIPDKTEEKRHKPPKKTEAEETPQKLPQKRKKPSKPAPSKKKPTTSTKAKKKAGGQQNTLFNYFKK